MGGRLTTTTTTTATSITFVSDRNYTGSRGFLPSEVRFYLDMENPYTSHSEPPPLSPASSRIDDSKEKLFSYIDECVAHVRHKNRYTPTEKRHFTDCALEIFSVLDSDDINNDPLRRDQFKFLKKAKKSNDQVQ